MEKKPIESFSIVIVNALCVYYLGCVSFRNGITQPSTRHIARLCETQLTPDRPPPPRPSLDSGLVHVQDGDGGPVAAAHAPWRLLGDELLLLLLRPLVLPEVLLSGVEVGVTAGQLPLTRGPI